VEETRERELFGACAAADDVGFFDDKHLPARACEFHGRGEAIWAGAHNNSVKTSHSMIMAYCGELIDGTSSILNRAAVTTAVACISRGDRRCSRPSVPRSRRDTRRAAS